MSDQKDVDIFPPVTVAKFHDHVEDTDRLAPEQFGSYAFQLMILDELSRSAEFAPKIYEPTLSSAKKNRYMNVLPSEEHRVKLTKQGSDDSSDYINASFIKSDLPGADTVFIATQAPIPNSFADFWRMIWEQKIRFVLMLTDETEKGRHKAHRYWPSNVGDVEKYGDITVKYTASEKSNVDGMVLRNFEVTRGSEKLEVLHMQYKDWPDHGVPKDLKTIYEFFAEYRKRRKVLTDEFKQPLVLHCSAGIGRTGSFALIDIVLDYVAKMDKKDTKINIFNILKEIRKYRPGAVQTPQQYTFCYKFLDFCISNGLLGVKKTKK